MDEESKNVPVDTALNLHQFYTVLMKPLAVGKCANLKLDKAWLAKMDTYFK